MCDVWESLKSINFDDGLGKSGSFPELSMPFGKHDGSLLKTIFNYTTLQNKKQVNI